MRDRGEKLGKLLMYDSHDTSSVSFRMHRVSYGAPSKLRLELFYVPKMAMSLLHADDAMTSGQFQELRVTT
eukprot:2033877-Pyramimonas_sp.AAC.1